MNIGASKRTARFIVGTTQAGWEAKDVDYLCTGTNDHEQINNALNALPEDGGEVIILDGIYNIEGAIHVVKDNTTLRGNGNATVLKRMYNSDATYTSNTARGLITLNDKKGCEIKNLHIDGNKNNFDSVYNCGILMVSSSDNNIIGNTCNNNNRSVRLYSSNRNTITDNIFSDNGYGVGLYFFSNNNTITGNTCNNNNSYGVRLYSSNRNTITDNICSDNGYGIHLTSSSSNNCIVRNVLVDNNTAYSGGETGSVEANNVIKK